MIKKKENNFARFQPLISFNGSQLIGLCRVFYQTSYSEEYTVYCIYDIFNFRKRYVIFWPLCLRFIYYYSQLAIGGSLSKYNVSNVYGDKNISGRLKCMSLSSIFITLLNVHKILNLSCLHANMLNSFYLHVHLQILIMFTGFSLTRFWQFFTPIIMFWTPRTKG